MKSRLTTPFLDERNPKGPCLAVHYSFTYETNRFAIVVNELLTVSFGRLVAGSEFRELAA